MSLGNCRFSAVAFTGGASFHRLVTTSRRAAHSLNVRKSSYDHQSRDVPLKNEVIKQNLPSSRDKNPFPNADGSSRNKTGRRQSVASVDIQEKGNRGVLVDLKDQQVEIANLQDASFLNAVVKVYCTHTAPDCSLPWQKQRQYASTGSAFMIGDGKLLTNAHCVEHATQVKVKRRGDETKYVAKVAFWKIQLVDNRLLVD